MSATGPAEAGFTLLEMLVVLAVTALIASLSWPVLQGALAGQQFRSALATSQADLVQASARAIALDRPVRFVPSGSLDTNIRLAMPDRGITFFPDGSSNGGVLVLSEGRRETRVVVDPVTGATRLLR